MTKRPKPGGKVQRPAAGATQETDLRHGDGTFPIVGIGASAGGLEALEQFLQHMPQGSGMAFVIIQHLDPTHKGVMPELLQRSTSMEVIQVKDRTRVKSDHVYVIPPNKDISILHGVLHLLDPTAPRGLRLSIDFFFRSLADDRRERSVGVILSGMGTDGTLGLKAIKEKAGVVFVQDPASAKFDSMPRNAIDAGRGYHLYGHHHIQDPGGEAQREPGALPAPFLEDRGRRHVSGRRRRHHLREWRGQAHSGPGPRPDAQALAHRFALAGHP